MSIKVKAAIVLTIVALALSFVVFELPVASADVLVHYGMNEQKGHVLHNSAGSKFDGHIGRHVGLTGNAHVFSQIDRGIYQPGRIDVVPDRNRLAPGNAHFAVTVRFKWPGGSDNNLIQKGQGSPAGGLFKMKTSVGTQPDGAIKCLFRGSTGDSQVESYGSPRLDDSEWHTVTCIRNRVGTIMAVDGKQVDANGNDPGIINNDWPIAIGGNSNCNSPDLECNYWRGQIGDIKWQVGR